MEPIRQMTVDRLRVKVYADRRTMGMAAGQEAAGTIRRLLEKQERVRIVFAAAPSQHEFLETLCGEEGIDWPRVTAFHMDEYIGLDEDAPQRFSRFLSDRLFDIVHPGSVNLIDGSTPAMEACAKYAALLKEAPIDLVCLGIGENGHIAFNDPPVADFQDPQTVKVVELDEACRTQQVNDGCFPDLASVPTRALTLTIPALLSGARLFCTVPGPRKREAVQRTLYGSVSEACPATALRGHPDCTLYVDRDAFGE